MYLLVKRFLLCVFCLVFGYYLAVLIHEYAHSFTLYVMGAKGEPFRIHYGFYGILWKIDEMNHYNSWFPWGRNMAAGISSLMGVVVSFLMAWLSVHTCRLIACARQPFLLMLLFWTGTISLAIVINAILFAAFKPAGDTRALCQGLGVSPVFVYAAGVPLVLTLGCSWVRHAMSAVCHYFSASDTCAVNTVWGKFLVRAVLLYVVLMLLQTIEMIISGDFSNLFSFKGTVPERYLLFIAGLLLAHHTDNTRAIDVL